jgi:hypothetical protein
MNITARACANCAQFNPEPQEDQPVCWNFATFTERPGTPSELTRDPIASDVCPEHQSHEEDAFEDIFIDSHLKFGGLSAACAAADACAVAHAAIRRAALL